MEKVSEILKANGFKGKSVVFTRIDGYEVNIGKGKTIVDGEGNVFYAKNNSEIIGNLALTGVINRLF